MELPALRLHLFPFLSLLLLSSTSYHQLSSSPLVEIASVLTFGPARRKAISAGHSRRVVEREGREKERKRWHNKGNLAGRKKGWY